MRAKVIWALWAVSILGVAAGPIIRTAAAFMGMELSDAMVRAVGMIQMLSLPLLAFTSVDRFRERDKDKE